MVLIRATVAPGQPWPADTIVVTVPGRTEQVDVVVHVDTIAEVLGLPWMPPQDGDVVLDCAGDAWQYRSGSWSPAEIAADRSYRTDDLLDAYGPLVHVARDGKPVES